METIIKKISKNNVKDKEAKDIFKEAALVLKNGGLVAFPTETVYGLGADALNPEASAKIYAAKGRPSDNPLIVHIGYIEDLYKLCKEIPDNALKLVEKYWPGPLTIVLKKDDIVPNETTGGLDTVAIRMPDHEVALELIRKSGIYLAAPSANISGKPSPTQAEHVIHDMRGKIDYIIDGGEVGIGIESTIVDFTSNIPTILRPGYITLEMVEEVVDEACVDKAILKENKDMGFKPKAPGMKYKHYAPYGELTIVEGEVDSVVDKINTLVENKYNEKVTVGVIATEETAHLYKCGIVRTIGSMEDELSISRGLYRVLREFDELEVEYIYTEAFTQKGFSDAIMNRLLKAAGYKVISV